MPAERWLLYFGLDEESGFCGLQACTWKMFTNPAAEIFLWEPLKTLPGLGF